MLQEHYFERAQVHELLSGFMLGGRWGGGAKLIFKLKRGVIRAEWNKKGKRKEERLSLGGSENVPFFVFKQNGWCFGLICQMECV